jgi:hypothetical protein
MAQILIRVDEDVVREVRRIAKEKYGGKRGALSMVVEGALRQLVSPPAEISASTLLDVIDYVSRASRDGQPKEQILANVFIMLDREFEQSVIRGTEDSKARRVKRVPRGEDPVEFLRKLTASHKDDLASREGFSKEYRPE